MQEPPVPPSEASLEFRLVEFSFSLGWDQSREPRSRGEPRRGHPRAPTALGRRGRRGRGGTALPPAREIDAASRGAHAPHPQAFPHPGGASHASRLALGLVTHGQHRWGSDSGRRRLRGEEGWEEQGERRRRRGGGEGREPTREEGRGGEGRPFRRDAPAPSPTSPSSSPPTAWSPAGPPLLSPLPSGPGSPQSFSGVRFSILLLPLSLQQK